MKPHDNGATPISGIRNLGPAMQTAFGRVGVETADELRALGTDAAYLRLLCGGRHRPHFAAFMALEMGLQGRPFTDCHGTEKATLRARFDALVARAQGADSDEKGRAQLDAALEIFGVVALDARGQAQPTSSSPEKK